MKQSLLTVLFLGLNGFITQGNESGDRDILQGKWKAISAKTGSPEGDERFQGIVLDFDGDTLRIFDKGLRQIEELSFKLNPKKKLKEIDFYGKSGPSSRIPLLGIYAIEGKHLRLSWSKIDGKFRPDSFDLPPGKNRTRQVSLVLQRLKEKLKK